MRAALALERTPAAFGLAAQTVRRGLPDARLAPTGPAPELVLAGTPVATSLGMETTQHRPNARMPWLLGVCVFAGVAGFLLWTEHRAHVLGVLPYLLFALCPLMHFFMHRGHGGHGNHHGGSAP